ncbi:MAG: hypothetical protein ACI8ZM_004766 [Crocinitomix sp.]|jgi:hypothetical protein
MKYTILLLAFISFTNLFASQTDPSNDKLSDSCLVVKNGENTVLITEGWIITVRIGDEKFKGDFKILNDSVIKIDTNEFLLSDIDMIAKSNKKKTFGLIMAQLPIAFTGFVLAVIGLESQEGILFWGPGIALIGGGITGVTLESYRGKRYRKHKLGNQNRANDVRNWYYSIGTF